MGLFRSLIEGFLRGRYGYEGNQAYWAAAALLMIGVLAVTVLRSTGPLLGVGTLVLGLLVLQVPRLALPLLIGAILVAYWLLFGPLERAAF